MLGLDCSSVGRASTLLGCTRPWVWFLTPQQNKKQKDHASLHVFQWCSTMAYLHWVKCFISYYLQLIGYSFEWHTFFTHIREKMVTHSLIFIHSLLQPYSEILHVSLAHLLPTFSTLPCVLWGWSLWSLWTVDLTLVLLCCLTPTQVSPWRGYAGNWKARW